MRAGAPGRTAAVLALLMAGAATAQEIRTLRPIGRSQQAQQAQRALPSGAVRVTAQLPVSPQLVETAMAVVARAWNERKLDDVLGPGFGRRQELLDAMQVKAPRDATLRVVSIQGWQVLDQYRLGPSLYSQLSVTVQTRVEFNDAGGFQARDGINSYVITVGHGEGP